MVKRLAKRLLGRYANLLRACSYFLQGRLRRVPVASLTSLAAFSFAQDGWHYFTAAIQELERHPWIRPEESVLARWYGWFRPSQTDGFLPAHRDPAWTSTKACYVPPWGGGKAVDCSARFEHWCGPKSLEDVRAIWEQLREAYVRLKHTGYRPWTSENGFIQVAMLVHLNGASRCLVTRGQHRAAIASCLGRKRVWVLLHRTGGEAYPFNTPAIVRLTDVASWPNVRSGLFSIQDAVAFFEEYFRLDGTERAVDCADMARDADEAGQRRQAQPAASVELLAQARGTWAGRWSGQP